jgi:predicted porin
MHGKRAINKNIGDLEMSTPNKIKGAIAVVAVMTVAPAFAQSSVTLYGIVDTGIGYLNNSGTLGSTTGGRSKLYMNQGVWSGSQFGFMGFEDLGGGTKALFRLEAGFNSATGAQQFANTIFGRQAYVGLSDNRYGTLTAGRQYTAYYQMLTKYSSPTWLSGGFGAHPGDLDGLDKSFRINNNLVYVSPTYAGVTLAGSYAFGGVAGAPGSGQTWSLGARYAQGPVGVAAGFMRVNNATVNGGVWSANSTALSGGAQPALSAINYGYGTAANQQRVAVDAIYTFTPTFDITASYSNVQYLPGIASAFHNKAIFNTEGVVAHWRVLPPLDLAAGYSYTAATHSNGISDSASYNQVNLTQFYSLSKRTGIYALEAFQRANGKTLTTNVAGTATSIVNATASIGDGQNNTPSSNRNQIAIILGIDLKF